MARTKAYRKAVCLAKASRILYLATGEVIKATQHSSSNQDYVTIYHAWRHIANQAEQANTEWHADELKRNR
jgi:hypothetical protein